MEVIITMSILEEQITEEKKGYETASWKKEWPDSKLVGFEYHAKTIPFSDYIKGINNEVQTIDFIIDDSNIIKVSYMSNTKKIEGKHEFKILESRKEEMLERLANIVNSDSSYSSCFFDDTIRIYHFIFENGEKVSYCCPIGNDKEYITKPMREYLNIHSLEEVGWML